VTVTPEISGPGTVRRPAPPPCTFDSFWIAGFECACHRNAKDHRLDMIAAVQHDRFAYEDYDMLRAVGIRTLRDGVRWHLIDRGTRFDFVSLIPMADAAERAGVQVIWDLCHYGWPDDVDVLKPAFVDRFARLCGTVARFFRERSDRVPFYTPVNEISFLAWAAARPLVYPHARGRDRELKAQFVRAAIAGAEAIWAIDARARIAAAEPLIHLVPPRRRPHLADVARARSESQFEAWDMLSGHAAPELGGHPKYLDLLGVNFYAPNQWEHPGGRKLMWDGRPLDDRWRPLRLLLEDVWRRYQRPLYIAETSHYGVGRAPWLRELTEEVYRARAAGVPIEGVCLYPILDRHDWDDEEHWHNSGLWDLEYEDGVYRRKLNTAYGDEFARSRRLLAHAGCR
jgi:beta-glucosidase/6-phospho-beta-glucosidase/beta-galactosidase